MIGTSKVAPMSLNPTRIYAVNLSDIIVGLYPDDCPNVANAQSIFIQRIKTTMPATIENRRILVEQIACKDISRYSLRK
jgi:hypothetical protein